MQTEGEVTWNIQQKKRMEWTDSRTRHVLTVIMGTLRRKRQYIGRLTSRKIFSDIYKIRGAPIRPPRTRSPPKERAHTHATDNIKGTPNKANKSTTNTIQCTIPAVSPKSASASFLSCSVHENCSLGTPLRQPPHTLISCCHTLPKWRVSPPIRSNLTK